MSKRARKKPTIKTAHKSLAEAIKNATDISTESMRKNFIDKFTMCDLVCKILLENYHKYNGNLKQSKHACLDMKTIPAAVSLHGLSIPRHILSGIFGGSKQFIKRGTKSAKKLRDGIVHAMNKDDIQEVVLRYTDLMKLMDDFLSYF